MWKSTTKVGVGIATSGDQTWIVAKYRPPGNVKQNYANNVGVEKKEVRKVELKIFEKKQFQNICQNQQNHRKTRIK